MLKTATELTINGKRRLLKKLIKQNRATQREIAMLQALKRGRGFLALRILLAPRTF